MRAGDSASAAFPLLALDDIKDHMSDPFVDRSHGLRDKCRIHGRDQSEYFYILRALGSFLQLPLQPTEFFTLSRPRVEGGVRFSVVAAIMGWSACTTVRMAKRYGHIGDRAQRLAVDALCEPVSEGGGVQNRAQSRSATEGVRAN